MANFTLSESERKEIESHARAIARKAAYNGAVEAWHDTATGEVQLHCSKKESAIEFF